MMYPRWLLLIVGVCATLTTAAAVPRRHLQDDVVAADGVHARAGSEPMKNLRKLQKGGGTESDSKKSSKSTKSSKSSKATPEPSASPSAPFLTVRITY